MQLESVNYSLPHVGKKSSICLLISRISIAVEIMSIIHDSLIIKLLNKGHTFMTSTRRGGVTFHLLIREKGENYM